MFQNIFKAFLIFSYFFIISSEAFNSKILNITCATANDEIENNPELRTIALITLEHKFLFDITSEIFKCLPSVAKVLLMPHTNYFSNFTILLPKETMIIIVADKMRKVGIENILIKTKARTLPILTIVCLLLKLKVFCP